MRMRLRYFSQSERILNNKQLELEVELEVEQREKCRSFEL